MHLFLTPNVQSAQRVDLINSVRNTKKDVIFNNTYICEH